MLFSFLFNIFIETSVSVVCIWNVIDVCDIIIFIAWTFCYAIVYDNETWKKCLKQIEFALQWWDYWTWLISHFHDIQTLFVCRKVVSFWKVNSGESEFLESEFRCLVVLWKMNWKTLSCVWLCYGKETEK